MPTNFRPMDDIFDDAVAALTNQDGKDTPTDLRLSRHDLVKFTSMKCVVAAMKYLCEVKGIRISPPRVVKHRLCGAIEIAPDISVYRFSTQVLVDYLRKKVTKLVGASEFRESLSVIRLLARDGLMEDGKETLLEGGLWSKFVAYFADHIPSRTHQSRVRPCLSSPASRREGGTDVCL